MAIRLQDIANDLNLSKMTISKVLRGQTDVSAETKARVLKRVKELNYRPNLSARGLRTGQTHTAGMVVPSLMDARVAGIVNGANDILRPANYELLISSADSDPDLEDRIAEQYLQRQVDALLFLPGAETAQVPQSVQGSGTPVVCVGAMPARWSMLNVSMQEEEVGRLAVEQLVKRGARRIAYLRGPRTAVGDRRFSGFLSATHDAGISVRDNWVVEWHAGSQYRNAYQATDKLLATRSRLDAIIAYSDLLAAGARDAGLAKGLTVPQQLQIVGCGNDADMCEIGLAISSIDLANEEIGRRAARLALRLIEKKDETNIRSATVAPTLVQRATTRNV